MRLIDADRLNKEIKDKFGYSSATAFVRNMQDLSQVEVFKHIMKLIEVAPTVEPQSEVFEWCHDCKEYDKENHCCHRWTSVIRKTVEELRAEYPTGEWKLDDTEQFCYCSNCEDTYYPRPLDPSWNYCPNCGAKMKGAEE